MEYKWSMSEVSVDDEWMLIEDWRKEASFIIIGV